MPPTEIKVVAEAAPGVSQIGPGGMQGLRRLSQAKQTRLSHSREHCVLSDVSERQAEHPPWAQRGASMGDAVPSLTELPPWRGSMNMRQTP